MSRNPCHAGLSDRIAARMSAVPSTPSSLAISVLRLTNTYWFPFFKAASPHANLPKSCPTPLAACPVVMDLSALRRKATSNVR